MRHQARRIFQDRLLDVHDWMRKQPGASYVLSIALFALAFGMRPLFQATLPPGLPDLAFLPAILIAACLCGTGPAAACALLSLLCGWYFFLPPDGGWTPDRPAMLALAAFAGTAAVEIGVIALLRATLGGLRADKGRAVDVATQRDTLFKEMQHRVGNNLNTISALLNIQARGLADSEAKRALAEAAQRIALIADINRMFHDPAHSDGVIDTPFVTALAQKCFAAAGVSGRIALRANIHPVALRQDDFLPVSLILTECLNNAIEHGIPGPRRGMVTVRLRPEESDPAGEDGAARMLALTIHDNGQGLRVTFEVANARSIGLQVVRAFATQLNGTFDMSNASGTLCTLRFPAPCAVVDPPASAPLPSAAARHGGADRTAAAAMR